MKVKHYTSKTKINNILKNGLRINSESELTECAGNITNEYYKKYSENKPLFFAIEKENKKNIFSSQSDYGLTINISPKKLSADLQSLVDYGLIFCDDNETCFFDDFKSKTLLMLKKYPELSGIMEINDLLDPENELCELAKELTNSGTYFNNISAKNIIDIETLNAPAEYLGNCVDSFDENGDSLIDIFSDVSNFACIEEESKKVSVEDFMIATKKSMFDIERLSLNKKTYLESENKDVYMIYDEDKDIHYFFKTFKNKELKLKSNLKLKL
tara:strand:- start:9303 stop:10115 length:813 start_codon:yes stop_codon:yes gene_type:complete